MAGSTARRIAAAAANTVTSSVARKPTSAASKNTPARKSAKNGAAAPVTEPAAKKPTAKKAAGKKVADKKAVAKTAPAPKQTAAKKSAKKPAAKGTTAPAKSTSGKAPEKKTGTKQSSTSTRAAKAVAASSVTPPRTSTSKRATSAAKQTTKAQAGRLAVKADEEPWTTAELAEVRSELDQDSSRLRSELNAAEAELTGLMRDAGDGAGNDQADVGSTTFERDHAMSLANNAREMLAQTERALARIDDGSYGVCESCGQPIGKMRLMAFPRATLCLSCKQREERR